MVRLASADRPDVLCLQEVPTWALAQLDDWSGMPAFAAGRAAPTLAAAVDAEVGRVSPSLNPRASPLGVHRPGKRDPARPGLAAFDDHRARAPEPVPLPPRAGGATGLRITERLAWAKERRVCQAVRVRVAEETLVVANLHATGFTDKRMPDAELLRAAVFFDGIAQPGEPCPALRGLQPQRRNSRTLAD